MCLISKKILVLCYFRTIKKMFFTFVCFFLFTDIRKNCLFLGEIRDTCPANACCCQTQISVVVQFRFHPRNTKTETEYATAHSKFMCCMNYDGGWKKRKRVPIVKRVVWYLIRFLSSEEFSFNHFMLIDWRYLQWWMNERRTGGEEFLFI